MIADQAEALRDMMAATRAPHIAPGLPGETMTNPVDVISDATADESVNETVSDSSPLARTIAITSGKGGVGKTTLAVNLAVRLSHLGRRVILLDADLGTANADVLCNIMPSSNLAHVVAGRKSIQDAVIEAPGGFGLIPGASGLAQMAALDDFERARLTDQMRQLQTEADVILIDTGAGVSPNVLGFLVAADQMLVVTTPDPTAITDAYAVIKTVVRQTTRHHIAPGLPGETVGLSKAAHSITTYDTPDIRVLVNMARNAEEAQAVADRIVAVCRKFLQVSPAYAGYVLNDPPVAQSIRQRRPFTLQSPNCPAAACIDQLAHRLDRHAAPPGSGRHDGLFRRMAGWFMK